VLDASNTGLRVQTNTVGGTVASYGGNGNFYVDRPGITGGRFTILENGNVGVGTAFPADKFHVAGGSTFSGNVNINATAGILGNLNVGGNGVFSNLGVGVAPSA